MIPISTLSVSLKLPVLVLPQFEYLSVHKTFVKLIQNPFALMIPMAMELSISIHRCHFWYWVKHFRVQINLEVNKSSSKSVPVGKLILSTSEIEFLPITIWFLRMGWA